MTNTEKLAARIKKAALPDTVQFCVEEYDAQVTKRREIIKRPYKDYLREIGHDMDQLIADHGPPTTEDGVIITIGLSVFHIVEPDENGGEPEIYDYQVENFDYIFNHWVVKILGHSIIFPANRLYATRLAATGQIIQNYRNRIKTIEAKIFDLETTDHPDSQEN